MPIWETVKFGRPNSGKVEKEKLRFRKQIKASVTLFIQLKIESEHIKALNRTKK